MDGTERVYLLYALLDAIHSGGHQLQASAQDYVQDLAELHDIVDADHTCQECTALFAPALEQVQEQVQEQLREQLRQRARPPLRLIRRSDEDTDEPHHD